MKRDIDTREVLIARIRGLQAIYPEGHAALVNWGRWSRDRAGIFPAGATPPRIWDEAVTSKFDDWGDEQGVHDSQPVKAERAEREEYDERAGTVLDERIHHPSGLPPSLCQILKVAYVSRETPEDQFPRLAGCPEDTFCERLEECLKFVGRFI